MASVLSEIGYLYEQFKIITFRVDSGELQNILSQGRTVKLTI